MRSSLLRRLRRFEQLRSPSAAAIRELYALSLTIALTGLSRRGHALTKKWLSKQPFALELRLADAMFSLYDRAPKGAESLHRLSNRKIEVASMQVIAAVVRGDLAEAVAVARTAGWFITDAKHADPLVHAIWALAHTGRLVEATALLEQWRKSFPDAPADARSSVLRASAWLEVTQLRFAHAARLLEEALAIAPIQSIQRCYAEADLAYAYAALGRTHDADEIQARWHDEGPASPIQTYRDLSRTAAALFKGRFDEVFRLASSISKTAERSGNLSVVAHARFWEVLSAPPQAFAKSFAAFRSAVAALQSVLYGSRLRIMDAASSNGTFPLRHRAVVMRTERGPRRLPFATLWAPDAEAQAADLFYDSIQRRLYIRGAGPIEVDANSLQFRALEVLFGAPNFTVDVDEFYEAVWGQSFHRLRHSTKLHVAVHRLRGMLHTDGAGPSDWIRVRGGRVGLAPELNVCVLEYESAETTAPETDVSGRVVHLLSATGPLAAPQIGEEIGLGRTATRSLLARLVSTGEIERTGAARATRYTARESAVSRKRP